MDHGQLLSSYQIWSLCASSYQCLCNLRNVVEVSYQQKEVDQAQNYVLQTHLLWKLFRIVSYCVNSVELCFISTSELQNFYVHCNVVRLLVILRFHTIRKEFIHAANVELPSKFKYDLMSTIWAFDLYMGRMRHILTSLISVYKNINLVLN